MLGILKAIWEIANLAFQFLANMILSLGYFIAMIPTYLAYLLSLVSVVPAFASAFMIAGITLTIVLFMLNRTE